MSCKVVPAGRRADIELLKLPRAAHTEPALAAPETPQAATPAPEQVEQARALHARIVDLERQLQRDVSKARDTGFREGEKAGRDSVAAEAKPLLERLARSLEELAMLRGRLRHEAESDLVQLAIAIARRILHRELAVDPDAITALIKTVLDKVQYRDMIRVSIHPDHESYLKNHFKTNPAANQIQIEANPALSRGDLLVETTRGQVDASIDTQLDEIERGFVDRIRR